MSYLLSDALGLKGWKKWALISAATVGGAVLGAFLGPYVAKLGSSIAAKLGRNYEKIYPHNFDAIDDTSPERGVQDGRFVSWVGN